MYYTIYKVTNKINGKFYIGKHQTKTPNDNYYGSGKAIVNAIKLYGKENFVKEVLFIFDNEIEMNAKEEELITEEFVLRSDTYNLGIGGEGGPHFKGKTFSEESKKKISNSNKGKKRSEETKQKLSEVSKKRAYSDDTKEKMRLSALNRKTGQTQSEETKQKIREARKKQVFSEETRRKMTESAKNRNNLSGTLAQSVSATSS